MRQTHIQVSSAAQRLNRKWPVWPPPSSHLDGDEHKGDDELGGGADELGRGHRPLPLLKDAVDAVGFGQHGGVSDGHAEAQQEAPECTHHHAWLGDHQECDQVDQEDTCGPAGGVGAVLSSLSS